MKRKLIAAGLSLFVTTNIIGCGIVTKETVSLSISPNETIGNTETSPTTIPSFTESIAAKPTSTESLLADDDLNNFIVINTDDFVTTLKSNTTAYNMCTWGEKKAFTSDGINFESYVLENVLGNAYIAVSRGDSDNLTSIYMTCPRGAMVYYYATNIFYSIDDTIDYKKYLESLSINENDEGLEGIHALQPDGMDIVFERKEDSCILTLMFYR